VKHVSVKERQALKELSWSDHSSPDTNQLTSPGRIGTHPPAFMQLYYAMEARNVSTSPLVVQFISPTPKAGVSVTTSGYARVAAEALAEPVLFVDASCRDLSLVDRLPEHESLVQAFQNHRPLRYAIVPAQNARNLFWTRLCEGQGSLLNLGREKLRLLLDELRRTHSLVVLDCGSRMAAEATAISRYCDGSILVVEAGRTSQSEIAAARRQIERVGGQVIGLVLNRERGKSERRNQEFA
jgi:Mrp family chromosome partitioning ATPase